MKDNFCPLAIGGILLFFGVLTGLVYLEHRNDSVREINPGCFGTKVSATAVDSFELREQRFVHAKRSAFERCAKDNGFPVIGFDAVVCLAPDAKLWAKEMPEWSVGPPMSGEVKR